MGSNDRQMIRDGNARHVFNTPDWISSYTARLDFFLGDNWPAQGREGFLGWRFLRWRTRPMMLT